MANRWADGFGRYGGDEAKMLNGSSGQAWAQIDDNVLLSNANPRTGTWHLRFNNPGTGFAQTARRVFGATLTEVYLGKAIYCASLPTLEPGGSGKGHFLFSLRDQANTIQCSLWLGTDGAIEARRGDQSGTVLGRTIPIIGAGAYQHLELYAKAGAGSGALELRVDQVTRLNLSGINNVTSSNIEFSQDATGFTNFGYTALIDLADVYCNDTTSDGSGCSTFIGDVKSGYLPVNADTSQADFLLSAGTSGYALLNESPPNDSNYISTTSTTARSDFGLANGPGNLSEVLTIRPFVRAKKDDAGTCLIAPSLKSGSTKATVSAQPITTAEAYYDSNVPLNPVTGVPWTATELNAAFEVIERTA